MQVRPRAGGPVDRTGTTLAAEEGLDQPRLALRANTLLAHRVIGWHDSAVFRRPRERLPRGLLHRGPQRR